MGWSLIHRRALDCFWSAWALGSKFSNTLPNGLYRSEYRRQQPGFDLQLFAAFGVLRSSELK